MSDTAEGKVTAKIDTDGRIAESWPCVECGYDLRTMHREGNCPECGAKVRDSLQEGSNLFGAPWKYKSFQYGIYAFMVYLFLSSITLAINILSQTGLLDFTASIEYSTRHTMNGANCFAFLAALLFSFCITDNKVLRQWLIITLGTALFLNILSTGYYYTLIVFNPNLRSAFAAQPYWITYLILKCLTSVSWGLSAVLWWLFVSLIFRRLGNPRMHGVCLFLMVMEVMAAVGNLAIGAMYLYIWAAPTPPEELIAWLESGVLDGIQIFIGGMLAIFVVVSFLTFLILASTALEYRNIHKNKADAFAASASS